MTYLDPLTQEIMRLREAVFFFSDSANKGGLKRCAIKEKKIERFFLFLVVEKLNIFL